MSESRKKLKNLLPKPTQGNKSNYNKATYSQSTLTNYTYSFLDGTNNYFSSLSPTFLSSNTNIIENSFTKQSLLNTVRLPSTSILGNNKPEPVNITSNKITKLQSSPCKKSKVKDQIPDEEVDSDLIALVKSIETVENLNSDSSGDTVIEDMTNTENSQTLLVENKLSSKVTSIPESQSYLYSSLLDDCKTISHTPLLNEHFSKSLNQTSNSSNKIGTSVISTSPVSKGKTSNVPRKAFLNSFMYDSHLPLSNNKSSKTSITRSAEGPAEVNQQFYASMGLDEDLCDLKTKVKENQLPELPSQQFLNINMTCNNPTQDFLKQPIKKERDASPPCSRDSKLTKNSNTSLLLNDMHISMTFEADPYDIDDEDDLPLSFLKWKSSGDESTEIEPKCQKINENTACELLPTFIKKEFIEEDEIVSATDCNSLLSSGKGLQNLNNSSLNSSLVQTSKNSDFSTVKVKTESTSEFNYSDSLSNYAASDTLNKTLPYTTETPDRFVEKEKSPSKNIKDKKKITLKNKKNAGLQSKVMLVEDEICEKNSPNSLSVSFNLLESYKEKMPEKLIENTNLCETFNTSPCPHSDNDQTKSPKNLMSKAKTKNVPSVSLPNSAVKKKNGKKVSKQKKCQPAQQTNIPSVEFPDNSLDFLKSTDSVTGNVDVSFSDSSLNSTKNEMTNKKSKKKTTKSEDNFDENLPITLLIKRQQSDSSIQSSDSFQCTTVNKPVFSESRITDLNGKFEDKHERLNSSSPAPSNSSIPSSDTAISSLNKLVQKTGIPTSINNSNIEHFPKLGKTVSKKKNSRKKGKMAINKSKGKLITNEMNKTGSTNLEPLLQVASTPDAAFSENSCSSSNFNKDTGKIQNIKNNDRLVNMEIEEQDSSSEESSTPLSWLFSSKNPIAKQSILSKELKAKNDLISDSESRASKQSGYMTPDAHLISPSGQDTPNSEIFSSASNLNVSNQQKINENNPHPTESEKDISPLKKKRRSKSNNWYKKKKAKKKKLIESEIISKVNLMTAAEVCEEPVGESTGGLRESEVTSDCSGKANGKSEIKVITNKNVVSKMPVVLVQTLENDKTVEYQKDETSEMIEQDKESTNVVIMSIAQEDVHPISSKRKRRKKAGNARKRKKVSNVNKVTQNGKKNLDASETFDNTETTIDSDSNLVRSVNKDSESIPLTDTDTASDKESYIPFKELPVTEKVTNIITIEDSPIKPQNKKFFPSLSIDTIQKDIEGLESFIAATEHNKFKKDNFEDKIASQQELKQNINRPSTSITSILKPVDSAPTSNLYKNSTSLSFICTNKSQNNTSNAINATSNQPHIESGFTASIVKVEKEKSYEVPHDNFIENLYNNSLVENMFNNVQSEHSILQNSLSRTEPSVTVGSTEFFSCNASQSLSILNKDTSKSSCQPKNVNDTVELAIKKEAFNKTKSISSTYGPVRNLDELFRNKSNVQNYFACAPQTNSKSKTDNLNSKVSNSSVILPVQPTWFSDVEDMVDDEILVIKPTPKVVPCVDLSDDESTYLVKENKNSFQNGKLQPVTEKSKDNFKNISNSSTQSEQNIFQISGNKRVLSDHQKYLGREDFCQNDDFFDSASKEFPDTEKVTIDPLVVKEKYLNEYFRCPFPPSVPFNYRQRGKNKIYSRINSQSLNLSIEKVSMRLKNSCNIKYQFGNKLGDIVKLEKYPVSASEVECYHRILGVAPSHDLLSKCFKIPDKNSFEINELKLYKEFAESGSSNINRNNLPMICSLYDIIQGITESKIMSDNSENLDRNCPSTDTRDSLESHLSSVSDTNFAQNKGVMNFKNVLDESKKPQLFQDVSSSSQNTHLSSISDLQNESKTANSTTIITKHFEEMSSYNVDVRQTAGSVNSHLSLSAKDTADSVESIGALSGPIPIVKSANESNVDISPELDKKVLMNNTSDSLSDHHAQPETVPFSLHSPSVASNEDSSLFQNASHLIQNLDVPVLRKILEVANSFSVNSGNTSNGTEIKSNVWESKTTFEYNHTLSTPITETKNKKEDGDNHTNKPSASESTLNMPNHDDHDRLNNSDDDFVDNEPMDYESSDVQKDEEPIIPEYKSKWEKIMERKALERKGKVNEHLLKDCFPVSSKVPSKKLNVSNKDIKKCSKNKRVLTDKHIKAKDIPSFKSSNCKKKPFVSKTVKTKDKIVKDSNADIKCKSVTKVIKTKDISKVKKVILNDTDLFAPDKPVTKSQEKLTNFDREKDKTSKKFYGNRVTNRGTFLTESSACLNTIKIPKKKYIQEPKKYTSVRSEEFHSMIKSPNIHFESKVYRSKYNVNKRNTVNSNQKKTFSNIDSVLDIQVPMSNELKKECLFNQIPVHTTNPRDPRQADQLLQNRNYASGLVPLWPISPNEIRKPLLDTPTLPFSPNDGLLPNRTVPLLSTPSTSFHFSDDPYLPKFPLLSTPQSSAALNDPLQNTPPMSYLENILKSVRSFDSSTVGNDGILPLPKTLNSFSNNEPFPPFTPGFEELTNSSTHSDVTSSSLLTRAYKTDLPNSDFTVQNSIPPNFAFQAQLDPSIVSQSLKSSNNPINQLLPQPNKKATSTCLVPQHLKSLVGHSTIETANVRLLMLEWSVDWLMQQQKNPNPPPISKSLKKVVSSYDNFEDHYNTYFPLMMLDTWHRIYVSWTHLSQASPYFCDITSYSVKSTYVSVECQTIFNTTAHPKGVFPDEGSILMIKYGTKSNDFTIKILGYVTNVKTRHFNQVTDSRLCNFKPPPDGKFDMFQVLTLSYMGAYNSEDIDKRLPIRIHVLCNVKATLKQNDALLYIDKSPLLRSILNPIEDGRLRSVALTPRNSSQDKVNECVRDITKGILSLHPLALLTIVRAVPQSDRLNIIPLLIAKMKKVYRTKVLLCVRTVRALGDIAANVCLHESLKLVIINKRCDTSPQFQKYLLDELMTTERSSATDGMSDHLHSKNEAAIKTKKQILKDCDVVLSLIRNCHDEFMESTFRDTECVAQMCCIIDEANLCTEPETLIPILHGISKLILIGDPDYPAKVLSKTASSYDYNRSFFHRAHDLDLITE